jgi:subtilisin family serine protease
LSAAAAFAILRARHDAVKPGEALPIATVPTVARVDENIAIPGGGTTQVLVSGKAMESEHVKIVRRYSNLDLILVEVDTEGLALLDADRAVDGVAQNRALDLFADPLSTLGGDINGAPMPYYSDGSHHYAGSASTGGYEVAVIDTGVDYTHTALDDGQVVAEACFNSVFTQGSLTVSSQCPGGSPSSTIAGAGRDCAIEGCGHGTMVAGSVAMPKVSLSNGVVTSGSSPAAQIIAVKIASKQSYSDPGSDANPCRDASNNKIDSCVVLYLSDVYAALD